MAKRPKEVLMFTVLQGQFNHAFCLSSIDRAGMINDKMSKAIKC